MGSFFPLEAGGSGVGTGGVGINVNLPDIKGWLGSILNSNGSLKVQLTQAYDSAEVQLKQNLAAYKSGSANVIRRNQALDFFDKVWAQLYDLSVRAGQQGMVSWNERQRSANGGKWPWPEWYRDPISLDPRLGGISTGVGDALSGADDALSSLTGTSFGTFGTIAVLGVLVFIGWRAFK